MFQAIGACVGKSVLGSSGRFSSYTDCKIQKKHIINHLMFPDTLFLAFQNRIESVNWIRILWMEKYAH